MVNENKNVVIEVEERHFLFKCVPMDQMDKITHCLAEFVGTASLLVLSCMTCMEGLGSEIIPIQAAFGGGLTVLVIVSTFGGITHCHINPAVTLAAAICRYVSVPIAICYMISQILGAIAGFALLRAVTPSELHYKGNSTQLWCLTLPNERIDPIHGFAIEAIITTLLIWLCCALWDARNSRWQDSVSMKFGFTVIVMNLAAGQLTGSSMNPARSLAPALIANYWTDQWIYWAGPITGSVFASLCYKYIFHRNAPKECCTVATLKAELIDKLME
ncbi:unnamed protein product [Hermetia illucens]|nr:unnamed protein product [Hermetia illucens]